MKRRARTLALTLDLLPCAARARAWRGYRIAREADDVADDTRRPRGERLAWLRHRRAQILSTEADAGLRRTLVVIFDGMIRELGREGREPTRADLEEHLYAAGGVVGEYLADLFEQLCGVAGDRAAARAYGEALELINVVRDRERDAGAGRAVAPPDSDWRELAREALRRLNAGWRYVEAIPHRRVGLKLACSWPGLIGLETLAAAARRPGAKIPRRQVRRILAASALAWLAGPRKFGNLYWRRGRALADRL